MKICLSAGEVSGDVHAAYLVKELKKLRPDISFFGLGSEKLAAEGVDVKFDITKRGTIGLLEALPNVLPLLSVFSKMKRLLLQEKPDLVILVDSQGFNLPLAKFCKQHKIKTVYYIAPQEWLWGTPAGVKRVAQAADLIVAIFEKEYLAYKKAGANVIYFGHPLIDMVKSHASRVAGQICICPGSRTQELNTLFPVLLKSAKIIQEKIHNISFVIPAASQTIYNKIDTLISRTPLAVSRLRLSSGQTYDALAASELAICASGTINLEASILGTPNIMIYKLSRLTYWLGKHILKIDKKIQYFSMPNILLGEKAIPELIMADATPAKIAGEAVKILQSSEGRKKMERSFKKLRELLGGPEVMPKIAKAIIITSDPEGKSASISHINPQDDII